MAIEHITRGHRQFPSGESGQASLAPEPAPLLPVLRLFVLISFASDLSLHPSTIHSSSLGDASVAPHFGALVGGVGLLLNHEPTLMFQKAGMLAPDGRCKTLDASADGYVR